jgi:hypothetical protein
MVLQVCESPGDLDLASERVIIQPTVSDIVEEVLRLLPELIRQLGIMTRRFLHHASDLA